MDFLTIGLPVINKVAILEDQVRMVVRVPERIVTGMVLRPRRTAAVRREDEKLLERSVTAEPPAATHLAQCFLKRSLVVVSRRYGIHGRKIFCFLASGQRDADALLTG